MIVANVANCLQPCCADEDFPASQTHEPARGKEEEEKTVHRPLPLSHNVRWCSGTEQGRHASDEFPRVTMFVLT